MRDKTKNWSWKERKISFWLKWSYGYGLCEKKPIWFDFLFCLGFYLLKREEKKRMKKKEEKGRRGKDKVSRKLRLGNYPNFSFFVLLVLIVI